MKIEKDIASKIKNKRIKLGYSQRQLAELCGMNYAQLAKIELASNSVSVGVLERICKPLGLQIELSDKAD